MPSSLAFLRTVGSGFVGYEAMSPNGCQAYRDSDQISDSNVETA
jgi:hypothetical protein